MNLNPGNLMDHAVKAVESLRRSRVSLPPLLVHRQLDDIPWLHGLW